MSAPATRTFEALAPAPRPAPGEQVVRRRRALAWTLGLAALSGLGVVGSATLGPARIPLQTGAGILPESVGIGTAWGSEATGVPS